jgi:hypothetical protein
MNQLALHLCALPVAAWVSRSQQQVIEYLIEEKNRCHPTSSPTSSSKPTRF